MSTTPESGAEIMLNGNPTEKTTPTKLDKLASGEHTITVRKEWYQPHTQRVTVTDGQELPLNIILHPTFGNLKVTADADATIYIGNEFKAKGSWEGRLTAGWYTVEARKENYISDSQRLQIELGQTHNLSLHPKPRNGELRVFTTPFDAVISLNGKEFGSSPATLRNLLIGNYILTLTKPNYGTVTKTITIVEGKTTEVNETLPGGMEVTIASTPSGAQLWVNGKVVGTTPYKETMSFGNHSVKLVNDKKVVERIITVSHGGEKTWHYDVEVGLDVTITSTPTGADLFLNGENVGKTPFKDNLKLGNHSIKLANDNLTYEQEIKVERGVTYFWYDLQQKEGTFTDSRDGSTYKWVKIGKQVWMAENLAFKSGRYWAYGNNQNYVNRYGYLYDWQTARNVCPTGWRLPSNADWAELQGFVANNPSLVSRKLKAKNGWNQNGNGTDDFGFSALPGGRYSLPTPNAISGSSDSAGGFGYWWSSTESDATNAMAREISYGNNSGLKLVNWRKYQGISVRCIEN